MELASCSLTGSHNRLFVVVDSLCQNFQGHYYEYSTSVLLAAQCMGYQPVLLANAKLAEHLAPPDTIIRRILTQDSLLHHRQPTNIANSYRFYREIVQGLHGINLEPQDMILMHTLNPLQVDGWRYWVQEMPEQHMPRLALIFRHNLASQPELPEKIIRLYQCDRLDRICFLSDSALLANEYARSTGIPFTVVPIPVKRPAGSSPFAPLPDKPCKLKLAYLGACRSEKGYQLLAPALEKNLDLIHSQTIEVAIQSNFNQYDPQDVLPAKIARNALEKLARRSNGGLSLIYNALSQEEYERLLCSADIVLLPYLPDVYQGRSSGIFAEALAAGKAVVASPWAWSQEQMQRYPCGIIMDNYSAASLAKAIREAVSRYAQICPKPEIVEAWNRYHSPQNLFHTLLHLQEQKKAEVVGGVQYTPEQHCNEMLDEMALEIERLTQALYDDSDLDFARSVQKFYEACRRLRTKWPRFYKILKKIFYLLTSGCKKRRLKI
jgi:glycosyltransferase involved in cell wall biosynthesis